MLTSRDTDTSGAISHTVNPGSAWQLEEIRVHLSAAGGAGDLTATIDNDAGEEYDTVILTEDMTSTADVLYAPERPLHFAAGDKLIIAYSNANNRTYGVEVKFDTRGN
jgi:hypothetical protein